MTAIKIKQLIEKYNEKQKTQAQIMFELKSPLLLVIDITNDCNLSCDYCFQDFRCDTKKSIPLNTIKEILSEAKDMGIFEVNICGGEPFKHKDIIDIITEIKRLDFNISIVTNGTLINKRTASILNDLDVIKNIQISFDSHIESVHNRLRGGYSQAIRGLDYLLYHGGPTPSVGIVISKENIGHITESIDFFYRKGIKRFHMMNLLGNKELSCSDAELNLVTKRINERFSNEKNNGDKLIISNLDFKKDKDYQYKDVHINCLAGYTTLVITSSLNIIPCDMVNHVIKKWQVKGDLRDGFETSKKQWRELKESWCKGCFKC